MSDRSVILTPDQRLRVFISSTLQELAPERKAAKDAVTRLRLSPVMFELGARPHPPRNLYRSYLRQSHIFVGIYWQSYGWVAPQEEVSGLEDEYLLSGNMPKLIYVKTPAPNREEKLRGLLNRIKSDDHASYKSFSTAAELRTLIERDLALMLTESFQRAEAHQDSPVPASPSGDTLKLCNLPAQLTPIVGRRQELRALRRLLEQQYVRLITLHGPGGIGKTKLAIEAASQVCDKFEDGAWFVPLSTVSDPGLLVTAIAHALGLREVTGQSLSESLHIFLRDKHVLLVLDNFEQLLPAANTVSDLLSHSEKLKILITSRAVLRLSGESEFQVPPLALPDRHKSLSLDTMSEYEAVRLFAQRAQAASSNFVLTEDNAAAVAEICQRVDGLPLAIELAAARVRLFPPRAILARIDGPLKLLTGGARDLPSRQQTLRNTIEWSYSLLSNEEQVLFARLAVFAGGFTLEAAEAVCTESGELDILSGIESLVEKSLLWQHESPEGDLRFAMLHIIHEYAVEKLHDSADVGQIIKRHSDYYLGLAEEAEPHLRGQLSLEWLEIMEREGDNLRTALSWLSSQIEAEPKQYGELMLRFTSSLWRFWYLRGHWSEGRMWLERALSATREEHGPLRARALSGIGLVALFEGDYGPASAWLEESLALFRDLGDPHGIVTALTSLGYIASFQQHLERARKLQEEVNALRPELEDPVTIAYMLIFQGLVAANEMDIARSIKLHEDSLVLFRRAGDKQGILWCLTNLGLLTVAQNNLGRASELLKENLMLARQVGDQQSGQYSFLGLASVALASGQTERAVQLWGAAEKAREATGLHLHSLVRIRTGYDTSVAAAREQLGEARFEELWAAGRTKNPDEVAAYALGNDEQSQSVGSSNQELRAGLDFAPQDYHGK